jgi:hypothetical protein
MSLDVQAMLFSVINRLFVSILDSLTLFSLGCAVSDS